MTAKADGIKRSILLLTATLLAACAPPAMLPAGPTPIPTLFPVTEISVFAATAVPSFSILGYPAGAPSAEEGFAIYLRVCADCHGEDGTGIVPGARDFTDTDYVRGETPAAFYAAIADGRGSMPAYKNSLTSDEIWDVVFAIWRQSAPPGLIGLGQEIYDDKCASCHGADGSGELLGSADFTDLRQMDSLAPRDLYLTITQGRGSMPAWQSLLSQNERWATIYYLSTFFYDIGSGFAPAVGEAPTASPPSACSSTQSNPFAWEDQAVISAGKALYPQCAGCHGVDGSGGLPDTPDFTSPEGSVEIRANPGESFCSLTLGTGSMPGYEDELSFEQRWQLVTYLASLGE